MGKGRLLTFISTTKDNFGERLEFLLILPQKKFRVVFGKDRESPTFRFTYVNSVPPSSHGCLQKWFGQVHVTGLFATPEFYEIEFGRVQRSQEDAPQSG